MKIIEHTADITATVEARLATLTDVDAYPDWHSFVAIDHTPIGARPRITVTVTVRPASAP